MTTAMDETATAALVMAETKTHMEEKKKPPSNDTIDSSSLSEEDQSSPRGVLEIPITDSNSSVDDNNSQEQELDQQITMITTTTQTYESPFEKPAILKPLNSDSSSGSSSFRGLMDTVRKNSSLSMRKFSSSTIALLTSIDLSRRTSSSRNNTNNNKRAGTLSRGAQTTREEEIIYSGIFPPGVITKPSWRNFRYSELASASDNFSRERLLGKGGHAEVYEGCLSDGTVVAIKKLMKKKGAGDKEEDERVADFLSELGIIAHVDHHNTAKLIGFGVERGLFIVLQNCPRGSLASHLHVLAEFELIEFEYQTAGSSEGLLKWSRRYKVAIGVAKGLSYLHHECHRRIIHRDIKASNILLSEDFDPLISDFGLAKWLPDNWIHHVVHPIEGTFGYLAPEYFMHGIVHEKTDVFAFGVLLLELLTGRHAVDSTRQSLVMWAKPLLDTNNVDELIDPMMGSDYEVDDDELRRVMVTASMCINHEPTQRPYMKRVVELLEGEDGDHAVEMMKQQQQSRSKLGSLRSMMLIDASDLEDYTCSKYLKDLNRHRQLVME